MTTKANRLVLNTLTRYLGPSATIIFVQGCAEIGVAPDEFERENIPPFLAASGSVFDTILDSYRASQLRAVLLKFHK